MTLEQNVFLKNLSIGNPETIHIDDCKLTITANCKLSISGQLCALNFEGEIDEGVAKLKLQNKSTLKPSDLMKIYSNFSLEDCFRYLASYIPLEISIIEATVIHNFKNGIDTCLDFTIPLTKGIDINDKIKIKDPSHKVTLDQFFFRKTNNRIISGSPFLYPWD